MQQKLDRKFTAQARNGTVVWGYILGSLIFAEMVSVAASPFLDERYDFPVIILQILGLLGVSYAATRVGDGMLGRGAALMSRAIELDKKKNKQ